MDFFFFFFNPFPKWEQLEQHFIRVSSLAVMTSLTNPLIPVGIIAMNKDFGPNIRESQENTKTGTETPIKFM